MASRTVTPLLGYFPVRFTTSKHFGIISIIHTTLKNILKEL